MNVFSWNARQRTWGYKIALAVIALFGVYGVLSGEQVASFIALAAAVFAPSLALANITPDSDGDA